MNREQAEIAKSIIDVRDRVMSPHYQSLTSRFGELALNNVELERLRQEPEIRAINEHLVRSFVALLPQANPARGYSAFLSFTAQEARMIQSSALFMYGADDADYHLHHARRSDIAPVYLIGSKPNPKEYSSDPEPDVLLLMIESCRGYNSRILGTWWPELRAIEDKQAANEATAYKKGQIKEMFDEKTGLLVVDAFEQDSIAFRQHTLDYNRGYPKWRRGRVSPEAKVAHRPSWRVPGLAGGPIINWYNTNFDKDELECSFSDEFLFRYGVLERLGDIATKFGLKDELRALIDSHTVDFKDPMDRLLEE